METELGSLLKNTEKRTWKGEEEGDVLNLCIGLKYRPKGFLKIEKATMEGEMQVIVAFHDDDELECWFEGNDRTWGLTEHIKQWIGGIDDV